MVNVKQKEGKVLVLIGGGYEFKYSPETLNYYFREAKGHAYTLLEQGTDREKEAEKTKKVLEAMDRFMDTLTEGQEKLYNEWNNLRNDSRDALEKELFVQGFFTGLNHAAELLLRGQVENLAEDLNAKRESAVTG